MKRLVSLLLACSLVVLAAVAHAAPNAPNGTYLFEAVDGVTALDSASILEIEGLIQGETEARELRFRSDSLVAGVAPGTERCLKLALVAQSRPGRYALAVTVFNSSITTCKLIRR